MQKKVGLAVNEKNAKSKFVFSLDNWHLLKSYNVSGIF